MSKKRLPEVELSPIDFGPVRQWPAESSRRGKTRAGPTWLRRAIWIFLIVFALSIVGGVTVVFLNR